MKIKPKYTIPIIWTILIICFLMSISCTNKEKYPNFLDWVKSKDELIYKKTKFSDITFENFSISDNLEKLNLAKEWRDLLGGDKNVFLRDFLQNFRLA